MFSSLADHIAVPGTAAFGSEEQHDGVCPMNLTLEMLENSRAGPDYHSKKNRVFRSSIDDNDYVVKIFRGEWKERASLEHSILEQCRQKDLRTPEPVKLIGSALVMQYVEGENAMELFDGIFRHGRQRDAPVDDSVLSAALASWLFSFHSAFEFGLARNDTVLRNFIFRGGEIFGLDFEETSRSDPLADLGQLCTSIISTTPMFTEDKFGFARALASRYWDLTGEDRSSELGEAVATALRYYASFRTHGGELRRWASRFESGKVRI